MISQNDAYQLEWRRLVNRLNELVAITHSPAPSLPSQPTERDFVSIRKQINKLERLALSRQ